MGGKAMSQRALILFAHGARDPRWAEPFQKLAERLRQMDAQLRVELAFLELMSPRLPECVDALVAAGCTELAVVPVFLGQGGHVLRDLPQLEQEIRARHPQLDLRLAQAVGEDASVQEAMARYCLSAVGTRA
jgi:sirohydrochlorin cobaltochelatase